MRIVIESTPSCWEILMQNGDKKEIQNKRENLKKNINTDKMNKKMDIIMKMHYQSPSQLNSYPEQSHENHEEYRHFQKV